MIANEQNYFFIAFTKTYLKLKTTKRLSNSCLSIFYLKLLIS